MKVCQAKIDKIALFFAKARIEGMPHLDEMFFLDDLYKSTYESHRKYSFRIAQLKASEEIIKSILDGTYAQLCKINNRKHK